MEDVEPPGRRDLTVLEKFPCSWPPESHWELELDQSSRHGESGGGGEGEGVEGAGLGPEGGALAG